MNHSLAVCQLFFKKIFLLQLKGPFYGYKQVISIESVFILYLNFKILNYIFNM